MAAHVHHITERHPRAQRDAVFCLANVSSERSIPGRKPARAEQHIEVLRAITREQPRSPLDEVTRELKRRTGMAACSATVGNGLRQAGMRRLKPLPKLGERAAAQGSKPLRVGYTDAHWREDGSSGVNPDLTAAEWALVADLFEHDEALRGRPPKHPRKLMVNACWYVVRTGCAGRLLPKCFPPGHVVYKSFSRWAAADRFETMHNRLRELWRSCIGREPEPTAAIIDAQSTRSTAQGGTAGFDAAKKVKGRKRYLVIRTLGLRLAVTVTPPSAQDRDAAAPVVAQACAKVPGLKKRCTDAAYGGQCVLAVEAAHPQLSVEVVRHPGNRSTGIWQDVQPPLWPEVVASGYVMQARRWVVERTRAWNARAGHLISHHDIAHHDRSSWAPAAWIWLAEARVPATKLVK